MSLHESQSFKDEAILEIPGDRRAKKRYELDLPAAYQVSNRPLNRPVSARVCNMSSSGAAFTAETDPLKPGTIIQLSIDWPILLNGNCLLKLVAEGRVVRRAGNLTAMIVKRYQFRTQRKMGG